jgi:hypothetical protein
MYFWVLARSLLGAAWRWFSACVGPWIPEDDDLAYLAQSAIQRFDRALRARDSILLQAQTGRGADAGDEAIYFLDVALLMMSGAFDAVARVAHRAYQLGSPEYLAGWRRPRWREELLAAESAFEPQLDAGTATADTTQILGVLRNTIHGAGLQGLGYQSGSRSSFEHLARLPAQHAQELLAAMDRRGGRESFGIRAVDTNVFALRPDSFIERFVPLCTDALNELMEATDVTRLPGVSDASLMHGPPESDELFSHGVIDSVRLLAGL